MRSTALRWTLSFSLLLLGILPFAVTVGATFPDRNASARLKDMSFSDLSGKRYSLRSSESTPAIYLFLSTECPIANLYTSRILAMERAFRPLRVRFFAVYPNENETEDEIRQHAADWGLTCPVIKDDRSLVRLFHITRTPEAVLVNAQGEVLYQGRIDDNQDSEQVRSRDLATAVLAMYSGRRIPRPRTEPFGCPIRFLPSVLLAREAEVRLPTLSAKTQRGSSGITRRQSGGDAEGIPATLETLKPRSVSIFAQSRPDITIEPTARSLSLGVAEPEAEPVVAATATVEVPAARVTPSVRATPARNVPATTSITYTRDIAPLLFERCLPCHRQGEVAPFRIDSYQQAVAWAGQIRDAVTDRRMPPWKANSRGEFHDEMRLSNREIAILTSWVNGGTPYGKGFDMPTLPTFNKGWKLGQPDAAFAMPEEYETAADGRDIYRCFVIPTSFSEDRWISGIEYQPGNAAIVHHVSAFIDTSGKARQLDSGDPGPGYTNPTPANGPGFFPVAGQLGGWVPGHSPRKLPTGIGIFLPKGADIVLEVHYHPTGRPEKDRTRFGLYFAREEITKRLRIADVSNVNFRIPAGSADYVVEASAFVPEDITLLSVSPHMHLTGRSMRVVATLPSGLQQVLVEIPAWDFRWQPSYRFKSPVSLPRRTRIDLVAHFDNSEKNPKNPNRPPKELIYGEGSSDEMCTVFMAYTRDNEDIRNERVLAPVP